jgi:hypothetical protein
MCLVESVEHVLFRIQTFFLVDLPKSAKKLFSYVESVAKFEVFNFSSLRKLFVILALLIIPIFVGFGFGMQAVDVANESPNAILWFALAALLVAILVLIWEEIGLLPGWHRYAVTFLLEILVVVLFYQGTKWVANKGIEASETILRELGDKIRTEAMYTKWLKSQQQPVQVAKQQQITYPAPRQPEVEKPDVSLALIYPEEFAVLLLNDSSVLLSKPKWGFAIWNLGKVDDPAEKTAVLPIPTAEGDYIRPHEAVGPQGAISQVPSLVHPGDRLFGYVFVECPECLKSRYYWVYAVVKQGGWFSEMKTGYPDISVMGRNILTIRQSIDKVLSDIPETDRIPIYTSIGAVAKDHSQHWH